MDEVRSGPEWGEMSPADFDARRADRHHKRAPEDQSALFYVPTPTAEPKATPARGEIAGQVDIFGGVA